MKKIKPAVVWTVVALSIVFSSSAFSQLALKTNQFQLDLRSGKPLPDSGPLPQIQWENPKVEFTSTNVNQLQVKAIVRTTSALTSLSVKVVNAIDNTTWASKQLPTVAGQREHLVDVNVTLPDGVIDIFVECTTANGIIVSDKRQVLVGEQAMTNMVAANRKDYALIIATDKYDHWTDLVNPVSDGQAIGEELKNMYGFEVEFLNNTTVEAIWEKLRQYNERKFSPQDQLLIFFAGHGHFDETFGEGYVVAKNSLQKDPSRTTYISHNRLRGVINNISCAHILLMMDVCFGGTLDPVIAASRGESDELSVNQMLARKLSHRTRKYLTSGGKEYVSDGIRDKHSPFAGKLIGSLRSGGGTDRVLTLAELMSSLDKMAQLPRFGTFGSDEPLSDFVFIGKR